MDLTPHLAPHLRWPLLALALAAAVVVLLAWWARRPARGRGEDDLLVAHTGRLRALPRYRALVRRRLWRTALQTVAALVAVGGCLLLVARPYSQHTQVAQPSRDLILCLDASGSMSPFDAEVVRALRTVVEALPGDRVGLSIFNGATVVKFPLTDDREFVEQRLVEAETAFRARSWRYVRATYTYRSSQLGDGLVACARSFDRLEEDRSRVIIVASDNRPLGPPVHSLSDAVAEAVGHGVQIHALGAPGLASDDRHRRPFEAAVEATGGTLSLLRSDDAVSRVVDRIDRLDRRRVREPPRTVTEDEPALGVAVVAAGLVLMAGLGLRRRR